MVGNADIQTEQGDKRAQQPFGLSLGPAKGQAQQMPGLDRDGCIPRRAARPTRLGRMPGLKRLRRHPHRQAAALLERPVVLWPAGDTVGEFRVAVLFTGLADPRTRFVRGY
jgi:hypothetical protein